MLFGGDTDVVGNKCGDRGIFPSLPLKVPPMRALGVTR